MKSSKLVKALGCCPACESKELLSFEGDYFCLECDWDSLEISVERGDLTKLMDAWEEMQGAQSQVQASDDASAEADRPENTDLGGNAA